GVAAFAAALAIPAVAQEVTMMTGPQGGSWIPLGGALKSLWEAAIPGLRIQQQPGAGIANVRGIDEGKAQIGFANSSTTVDGVDVRHDGDAEVGTVGTGAPASVVRDLASALDVSLVPVDDRTMSELKKINPGYNKHVIEAGT